MVERVGRMRSCWRLVVLLFILLAAPVSAGAQERPFLWGVRAGVVDSEPMAGFDLTFRTGNRFFFVPNVEVSGFGVTTNADARYAVELSRDAALWGGLGIAAIIPDGQDLDAGMNVTAGADVRRGRYVLYVQVSSFAFGVRF
jgi:hypothetical protein